ncbi:class F sortase [Streptomyces sp. TR06-5]|uniref:class F sortase n=1 Tax=unclassified Streptomyces TaxID=2593676 RepID=UPI0039A27CD5
MAALLVALIALVMASTRENVPSDFGSTVSPGRHERGGGRSGSVGGRPDVPVRMSLPRQDVRAAVVPVGTTASGQLDVPSDADDVGWYRAGARPGSASGSAVLVGHVDSRSGSLGTLAALASVLAGDRILVRTADGSAVHYRITARRSVSRNAFPHRIFRGSGPPVLVLVTCAPPFDAERGGYQRLLLVTAVPDERGRRPEKPHARESRGRPGPRR